MIKILFKEKRMNLFKELQEKLSLNQFPLSAKYDIKWIIENEMGPNSLWLMEYLIEKISIKRGMRILDLGCGKAMSSIFLAKEYDVQIIAADLWVNASENMKRIKEKNVEETVFPINMEAHNMPFADECFDLIISADSYQYYGTHELYLDYCLKYLKRNGQIGIVVPALKKEYGGIIPEKIKPYWESDMYCYHTLEWWKKLWKHSDKISIETADIMPNGHENWLLWDKTLKEAGVLNRGGDVELLEASDNFTWIRIIGKKI
jgi:cyclopropane fatty-acyl-phospholipid synthase-like methyltransferase